MALFSSINSNVVKPLVPKAGTRPAMKPTVLKPAAKPLAPATPLGPGIAMKKATPKVRRVTPSARKKSKL